MWSIEPYSKYYQINYRDRRVGRISFLNKYFHDISDDVLIWWLRLSETLHEIKKIQISIYQLFLLNLCLPFKQKTCHEMCNWNGRGGCWKISVSKFGETVEVCQKTQLQRFGKWRSKARCTMTITYVALIRIDPKECIGFMKHDWKGN